MYMSAKRYLEQFERTKRWYRKFKEINDGTENNQSTDHHKDIVYCFFQNCHHLKDWIKNDTSSSVTKGVVKGFIKENRCLLLCADICNGSKHLILDRKPRSGETPEFVSKTVRLTLGSKTNIAINWVIQTSSGNIDAFQLATQCMNAWNNFFVHHDLC